MKILHVIAGDDNGGAGNHVLNLCSNDNSLFSNEIAFLGKGILFEKAEARGIKNMVFKKSTNNSPLIDYINNNSCDLAVFHGARTSLIHLIYGFKIKRKTVATIHSDYRYDFLNNKLKLILFTPLSTLGLKSFKNYITISNNLKGLIDEKNFKGNKYVVNNGLDIKGIKHREREEQIRSRYGISKDDFVFGMVGRFHPIKNHMGVIEGFSRLSKEYDNAKLLLIGDGSLRSDIEKLIKSKDLENKVFITGFVDNPIDYLKLCNCSIIASFSEGGAPPLVMLESAYARVPVMATRVGDLESIMQEEKGYLIENQSSEAIYTTMKQVCKDEERSTKGANIEKLLYDRFTLESFWRTYKSIYEKIIKL